MSTTPQLTFFCELDSQPLADLFAQPEVISFLQDSHSAVSLGLLDLSAQRAEVVRCLNQAGVPVSAWLLLPKDQGYWFNLDNFPQAAVRYTQFKAWTERYDLEWAAVGLDIEPDMRAIQLIMTNRWAGMQRMLGNALNTPRLVNGRRGYQTLVQQIQADGYPVETYQIPFIVDERQAGSNLLQRMVGLADLPKVDREVLMLYSSFLRPWGQGILWNYGPQAQGAGIGSTGGGVDLGNALDIRPLNWPELETDLLLAHRHTQHLYIFSLEGCVQQGLLPNLLNMKWQQPVQIPYAAAQRSENVRGILRRVLWLSGRPALLLFALALLVAGLTLLNRGEKKG